MQQTILQLILAGTVLFVIYKCFITEDKSSKVVGAIIVALMTCFLKWLGL